MKHHDAMGFHTQVIIFWSCLPDFNVLYTSDHVISGQTYCRAYNEAVIKEAAQEYKDRKH